MEEVTIPGGEQVEQSTVLSQEEVQQVVEGQDNQEVQLTSDEATFEMPEKFAGKSAEEIAKAYMELEKMKTKPSDGQEGGDSTSIKEEEAQKEEGTEENAPTPIEAEKLQEYEQYYEANGGLSDEIYSELEKSGYTKEQIDQEISFRQFQREQAIKDLTGDSVDKFKEVVAWAQENKTPEEIAEFNEALKGSNKLGQQALLKTLYAEAAGNGKPSEVTIHTNAPQVQASKGYSSESELFADMNNPAYKNDPKYQQKVMDKLAASDTTGWSF